MPRKQLFCERRERKERIHANQKSGSHRGSFDVHSHSPGGAGLEKLDANQDRNCKRLVPPLSGLESNFLLIQAR
jgi:hypothetical protein